MCQIALPFGWLLGAHTHHVHPSNTCICLLHCSTVLFSHLGCIFMVVQHCLCVQCVCLCVFHNMCELFAAEPRVSDDNGVRSLRVCKLFQSWGNDYVFPEKKRKKNLFWLEHKLPDQNHFIHEGGGILNESCRDISTSDRSKYWFQC